jgi:hypothetical protein
MFIFDIAQSLNPSDVHTLLPEGMMTQPYDTLSDKSVLKIIIPGGQLRSEWTILRFQGSALMNNKPSTSSLIHLEVDTRAESHTRLCVLQPSQVKIIGTSAGDDCWSSVKLWIPVQLWRMCTLIDGEVITRWQFC